MTSETSETPSTKSPEYWCVHCQDLVIGFAQVDELYLCHPSVGLDCYRLTEIYGHPTPCQPCTDVRRLLNNMLDEKTMLLGVHRRP